MNRPTSHVLIRARCCIVAASMLAGSACADGLETPTFLFSGFGTVGLVHSSEKNADFTSTAYKARGAGYSDAWSGSVDSLIGGQVTANFAPGLSAVVQVISEQNYDNTFTPHVEWANVRYEITPELSVRVGRIALPTFFVNDSRKVGYVNVWVRPPMEVYNLVPISRNDGIDASYRTALGSATNTLQVTGGQSHQQFPDNGTGSFTVDTRKTVTLVDSFEQGALSVRVTLGRSKVTIAMTDPLFDAFRQFGAQGRAIADRYDVHGRAAVFMGVGASYDPGDWFVTTEWAQLDSQSLISKYNGWYVTGGSRIGSFTPFVTYAKTRVLRSIGMPGLSTAGLPPQAAAVAQALNGALQTTLSGRAQQSTFSIGNRWDFRKGAALTVQGDLIDHDPGSAGYLTDVQPGFVPGGHVTVFTANVSFVF